MSQGQSISTPIKEQGLETALLFEDSLDQDWTKEQAKKAVEPLHCWLDISNAVTELMTGSLTPRDIHGLFKQVDNASVTDADLREQLQSALLEAKPYRPSQVGEIVSQFESLQQDRARLAQAQALAEQKLREEAASKVVRLRGNCSLDEWQGLNKHEQAQLLIPAGGKDSKFNKQDSDDIEWAQFSWNPVTGCKHD